MTAKELAQRLDGHEYGKGMTGQEAAAAKAAGLVIAYGYSDDLLEFEGAIYDEAGAYNGTTVCIKDGRLLSEPSCGDEAYRCKLYQEYVRTAHCHRQ